MEARPEEAVKFFLPLACIHKVQGVQLSTYSFIDIRLVHYQIPNMGVFKEKLFYMEDTICPLRVTTMDCIFVFI